MLTSGRDCAQIHELYRAGDAEEILPSFYFNSWLGAPDTADRLLRLLRELDVAAVPEPALDGKLAAIGPTAGQGMMTIDRRGSYDMELLAAAVRHSCGAASPAATCEKPARPPTTSPRHGAGSTSSASTTSGRGPHSRSGPRSASLTGSSSPGELGERLPELVAAINRGEGLPDPALADGGLALATRDVPGGTIHSYRSSRGTRSRSLWLARRGAATWKASRTAWS